METCNTCHAQTDSCNKCHSGTVPTAPVPVPAPMAPGSSPDGRVLYMRVCAACHGQNGSTIKQANISSLQFLNSEGDGKILQAASEGQGVMPPFSAEHSGPLTDDELRAILGYLKVLAIRTAAGAIDAKALYDSNCVRCHGSNGDKISGVKHSSKAFWYEKGEKAITKAISNGKGGMPPFGKPQGGTLSDIEIEAIVEYLKSFPGLATASTQTAEIGKNLFATNCAMCHGDKGDRVPSANLASKEFLTSRGGENLANGIADGKGSMPAYANARGGQLSDDQIKAIVDYITELAGAR